MAGSCGTTDMTAGRSRLARAAGWLLAAAIAASSHAEARTAKSLFRSQPVNWQPFVEGDGRPRSVRFSPSWTFDGFQAPFAGDPAAADGALIFASKDGRVIGLDPGPGTPLWDVHLRDALGVGPAAADGIVYQATRGGRIVALDAREGGLLWSVHLEAEATRTPRRFGDRLLVGTADGKLIALDALDGRHLGDLSLPGRPSTPPEPAPGAALIGTEDGVVVSLDPRSLRVRWRHEGPDAITAPPFYHDRRVYVASADRSIHCLRARNGKRRWTVKTGAVITARPFASGNVLYVLSYDNDIYLLKRKSGHLLARVRLGHRLDVDAALTESHAFVVPFTGASLLGLSLPSLRGGGQFDLVAPGEWFTTAPLVLNGRVAVGYGRDAGRVLALSLEEGDGSPDEPPARD